MSSELDTDMESDTDSDWLDEEGTNKDKSQGKKRKKNMTRRCSKSLHASPHDRSPSSSSWSKRMEENIKKETLLTVICGDKEGILDKKKFKNSEPCIMCENQCLTPNEFEKYGGKAKSKKWKTSIYYNQFQLQALIEKGLLPSPSFKLKRTQDNEQDVPESPSAAWRNTPQRSASNLVGKDAQAVPEGSPVDRRKTLKFRRKAAPRKMSNRCTGRGSGSKNGHNSEYLSTSESGSERNCSTADEKVVNNTRVQMSQFQNDVLKVTCVRGKGSLHVKRFVKATHGKCIRTQTAWLTPQDFLNINKPRGNWRRDIRVQGIGLGELIMERILILHTVNCKCSICKGDPLHLDSLTFFVT